MIYKLKNKIQKSLFLIAILLISNNAFSQNCGTGDVNLLSKTDVTAFIATYAGTCNTIDGNLTIQGNMEDISGLSFLTTIVGNLTITSTNLHNLTGLENITNIGGRLIISGNSLLANVDGISGLTSINEYIFIVNNNLLTNVDGFSGLTSIGDSLFLEFNDLLANVDGFSGLTTIAGELNIRFCDSLTNVDGFLNITSLGSSIIQSNNSLISLNFISLNYIFSRIEIADNHVLIDVSAFDNIQYIGGNISITNNLALDECCTLSGFINGTSILNGNLTVLGNNTDCASIAIIIDYCDIFDTNSDGDAIIDANDNCVNISNPNQEDTDADGIGDVCDNCPNDANPTQEDANNNGIGDACEASGTGADTGSDIGGLGIGTTSPDSQFEVAKGDVFIKNIHRGIIMKSPSGNKCFRVQINEEGNFKSTEITCPDN